jgi:BMFP domain-containing protein YqiC
MSSASVNWGPPIPLPPEVILENNKRVFQERMDNVIKEIERICRRYSFEFRNIQELIKPLEDYKRDFLSRYTIQILLNDAYHISWVNKNFENFNEIALKIKKFLKTMEMVSQEDWSLSGFDQLIKSIPEGLHKLKQDIESKFHETLNKRLQEAREKEDIKKMIQLYEEIPNSFSKYKDTAKNFITKYAQDKIRSFLNQDQLQGLYELDDALPKGFESLKEEIHQAVKKIVEKKSTNIKRPTIYNP